MKAWIQGGVVLVGVLAVAGTVQAQDAPQDRTRQEVQDRNRIYGSQLMTPQERAEYRERIRNMTPSQRAQFRMEHRRRMDRRAKKRGIQLPSQGGSPGMGGQGGGGRESPAGPGPGGSRR